MKDYRVGFRNFQKYIFKNVSSDTAQDVEHGYHNKFFLAKVVPEEKYADIFLKGEILMRNLAEFGIDQLIKDESQFQNDYQGDVLEGVSSFGETPISGFTSEIAKTLETAGIPADSIRYGKLDSRYLDVNILSLYSLLVDEEGKICSPNKRLREWGMRDSAGDIVKGPWIVVITDVFEFMRRISKTIIESFQSPFWFDYDRITYYDPADKHTDSEGHAHQFIHDEFSKTKDYSWQNEFRIVIETLSTVVKTTPAIKYDSETGTMILSIGELGEEQDAIAFKMPYDDFIHLNFPQERKLKMAQQPSKIFSLGLPRPDRLSFYHNVVKISDKIFITKTAMAPVLDSEKEHPFLFRQARAVNELRSTEGKASGYRDIADQYFRKTMALAFGKDDDLFKTNLHYLFEYMLNLGVCSFAGVTIDEFGVKDLVIDDSAVCHNNILSEQTKYNRNYSISDAAFLMAYSDERDWSEYEVKEGKLKGRYTRVVVKQDCVLPSGQAVKKGEAVWLAGEKMEWLSDFRDELELRKTMDSSHDSFGAAKPSRKDNSKITMLDNDESILDIETLHSRGRINEAVALTEQKIDELTASLESKPLEVAQAYAQIADMCMRLSELKIVGYRSFVSALACWNEISRKKLKSSDKAELAGFLCRLSELVGFSLFIYDREERDFINNLFGRVACIVQNLLGNSDISFGDISSQSAIADSILSKNIYVIASSDMRNSGGVTSNIETEEAKLDIVEFFLASAFAVLVTDSELSEHHMCVKWNALNLLSMVMDKRGRVDEQKALLLEMIDVLEQSQTDPNDIDFMIAYHNLGILYYNQNDFKNSEPYMLKSLDICEEKARHNPEKHSEALAMGYYDMGNLYHSHRQVENAIRFYQRSAEVFEGMRIGSRDKNTYYLKYIDCLLALSDEYKQKGLADSRVSIVFTGEKPLCSELFSLSAECIHRAFNLCLEMVNEGGSLQEPYRNRAVEINIKWAALHFDFDGNFDHEKQIYPYIKRAIENCKVSFENEVEASYHSFIMVLDFLTYFYGGFQYARLQKAEFTLPIQHFFETMEEFLVDVLEFLIAEITSGKKDILLLYHPKLRNIDAPTSNDIDFANKFQAIYILFLQSLCSMYADTGQKEEAHHWCERVILWLDNYKEAMGEFLYAVEIAKIQDIIALTDEAIPIVDMSKL